MTEGTKWKPKTVTLACGKQVLSDSPEWMLQCEAMEMLRQRSLGRDPMPGIAKKRGFSAANHLRDRMAALEPVFVLDRLRTKPQRHAYLDRVESTRGPAARLALQERVLAVWEERQKVAKE